MQYWVVKQEPEDYSWADFVKDGPSNATHAYGATLAYPNDRWNANLDVRTVEANFNPAVGFVTRSAYRRYVPYVNFGPRPRNNRVVRQYNFAVTGDFQTTLDGRNIARNFTIQPSSVVWKSPVT